jgi:hypothetical protein
VRTILERRSRSLGAVGMDIDRERFTEDDDQPGVAAGGRWS